VATDGSTDGATNGSADKGTDGTTDAATDGHPDVPTRSMAIHHLPSYKHVVQKWGLGS